MSTSRTTHEYESVNTLHKSVSCYEVSYSRDITGLHCVMYTTTPTGPTQ